MGPPKAPEGLGPWMAPSPARRRPETTYRAHPQNQSVSTNRNAEERLAGIAGVTNHPLRPQPHALIHAQEFSNAALSEKC